MTANPIAQYPQTGGTATLPAASAAGQTLVSSGAGTTYTAQNPAMSLIAEQILGSAAASVTFASIPQTFKHLKLVIASQTNATSNGTGFIEINFNGDVGANYSHNIMFNSNGNTVTAAGAPGSNFGYVGDGGTTTASSVFEAVIAGYASALIKGCASVSQGSLGLTMTSTIWSSTAAITSILLTPTGSFTFSAGSIFSLYGLQ